MVPSDFSRDVVVYDAMRVVGIDSYTDMHPLASMMQDVLCFPLYDGGNMGVRRRQLHEIIKTSSYDALSLPTGVLAHKVSRKTVCKRGT